MSKGRKARNKRTVIEDETDTPWYEEEQISRVVAQYYSELFTSEPSDGRSTVHKALHPCITQDMNEKLIRDLTPTEVKKAMFAIHADKAPGPDGFSASFYN